ncbi:MAG: iron ABC transporter permease [Paucibacter sp.]|nr:iron ABC transporter permease [Roseateles sp.]
MKPRTLLAVLLPGSALLLLLGAATGSTGFSLDLPSTILWDIRLPRSAGAWLVGALLGLAGAIAQGLFRNPLADPYLLGSASGASLGVAMTLSFIGIAPGWLQALGLTGAAFIGTLAGVLATLALARGAEQSLRLLLAGIVVGVVLTAVTQTLMTLSPEVMRTMTAFMLGNTNLLGWRSVALLGCALALSLATALAASRALDALSLGDATARSLGLNLPLLRALLVGAFALATAASVAQAGMIAFVGLVAPHLVRSLAPTTHGRLLLLSALVGGALLLGADVLSRALIAPQELPVGIVTALLGGCYLLVLMQRRSP